MASPVASMVEPTKLAPMTPAPPVTSSIVGDYPELPCAPRSTREPYAEENRGEQAMLMMQGRINEAHAGRNDPCGGGRSPPQPVVIRRPGRGAIAQQPGEPGEQYRGERHSADDAALGEGIEIQAVGVREFGIALGIEFFPLRGTPGLQSLNVHQLVVIHAY